MRRPQDIPAQVRLLQREVADPKTSAWVAANAGSGKTHVLAQRVINLLLDGVAPEKLLCITFTKAAAANMAKRVFDTLAAWTTLDDAALDGAIRDGSNLAPSAARRALARRLFARALETPGGLKVHTIHAFCTQLLHQFPFEAEVAARFDVLDDTERSQLLEELTLRVLLDGADNPNSPLGGALAAAMIAAADQTFRDVVRDAIGQRDAISKWIVSAGSVENAISGLSKMLGIDPADSSETVEAEFFTHSLIAPSEWPALAQGAKSDADQASRFAALPALSEFERVEKYLEIFCTQGRTPRKFIVTKAITDTALVDRLRTEQTRVCALVDRRNAVACRDRSAALMTVAYEVLTRFQKEKSRRGLLDYDDLINKTLELLNSCDAAWVHFKLDLGIDHLLIDEAQDTSAKQWEIVRRLVAEFTAGEGARDVMRTIFAVGDEKQSIYSFQNAAPREFAEMRRRFEREHKNAGLDFAYRKFEHSFRSGESVLGAVDAVFKDIAASVTSDTDGIPPHIALPDAAPSVVEIWEPLTPEPREPIEGWDAPFDTVSETSPRVRLARRIAGTVRRLVDLGEARSGDVLILVRQRGELFEAVIRALKNEGVAVAGADRLVLTEHIAVMDLMALADALLLPQDDLALATVLRSPLFGFEDTDLFDVAWNRGRSSSLRAALNRKAGEREIFAQTAANLDRLAHAARYDTPFAFYAHILGADRGRRRFLARLGPEANDALDEFLNLAFDYERRETPSLQGFVAWLREARAEVKRDMEIARDEVRVMTVHGAKGLEAPVVILADTMTPPAGPKPPRLLALAGGAMVWAGRKADDVDSVAAARTSAQEAAEDEHRRLLYVAMTRAADRLIVCGAEGARKRPDRCWYDLVRGPLAPFLVEEEDNGEKVLRYRKGATAAAAKPAARDQLAAMAAAELPAWLGQPAPIETPRAGPISPSSTFEEEIGITFARTVASAAERQKAIERGRLVHRLMQALPDIAPERRKESAKRYLANAAANFSAAEQAGIATRVVAILDDRRFAEIFASGSRAEVPIVGHIPCAGDATIPVAGQVDRLSVTDDAVLIADYKTDRRIPDRLDEVAPYVTQLALYRAVLLRLFSGKTVRAALVFTEGPRLMEIPGSALDLALDQALDQALAKFGPQGHAAVRIS